MGFRKKKKVEEVVEEEKVEEIPVEEAEEVITGEIEAEEPAVEPEVEEEVKEETEEEVKEELSAEEPEIRIGSKVRILRPVDFEGRPLSVDMFDQYTVYAVTDGVVQLRKQHVIVFVKLSNIKKVD